MGLLQALVLGAVAGATEFAPVSSAGHLVLVPFIFGWRQPAPGFFVAAHAGALGAAAWVMRDRLAILLRTANRYRSATVWERRLLRRTAIAALPAAVAGALLGGTLESSPARPVAAAVSLGVSGLLLYSAERRAGAHEPGDRREDELDPGDAAILGAAQWSALLPGLSRAGLTIGSALSLGLDRAAAARTAVLLSAPVSAGAAIAAVGAGGGIGVGSFVAALVTSAATGLWVLPRVIATLTERSMRPFAAYSLAAMGVALVTALARG